MTLLKVQELKSYYVPEITGNRQHVKAVDGVNFEINEDEIYGIAGESGCGKTTLIKTVYGLIEPPLKVFRGDVHYKLNGSWVGILKINGEELRRLRWEHLSFTPQASMSVLNPVYKVIDSFEDFIKAHTKMGKKEIAKQGASHLDALGLPPKVLKAYPHQLSGGMKQRVTIALATILSPQIVIVDEPTTALDVVAQRGVIQTLKDLQKKEKNAIILVTHDMGVQASIGTRIAIMYAGKIIEEASTTELYENPLHPYTKYLIGSLPKIGEKDYKISAPGSPPQLVSPPNGCRFHPRCEKMEGVCKTEVPKLVEVKEGHRVACSLYSEQVGR